MLGASSPCTALPLPATHCRGRGAFCSLGRSTARWQMTHTGRDAAALCFFPTGQHSSCPQPIKHFINATATGQHRLISCSGRQSNSPGFGSHSHYARQDNPTTSRVWDQVFPTNTGSNKQCIPKKAYAAPDVLWTCLTKQLGTLAPSRKRPWHHGKVVMGCCPAVCHIKPTSPGQHSPAWPGGCWIISQEAARAP